MDLVATGIGVLVLLWMFLGPIVGYTIRDRGWKLRSPFTRSDDGDGDE